MGPYPYSMSYQTTKGPQSRRWRPTWVTRTQSLTAQTWHWLAHQTSNGLQSTRCEVSPCLTRASSTDEQYLRYLRDRKSLVVNRLHWRLMCLSGLLHSRPQRKTERLGP